MGRLSSFFQRFTRQDDNTLTRQAMARKMRIAAKRIERSKTHKPAFSMGFRGAPRIHSLGSIPAPTIDQVRRLERAYMCKLHVKQGLIYFTDGTAFTHERGRAYRHEVMQDKIASCA